MKQLTRQEVEGLIDRLADKTLSFGCSVLCGGNQHMIGGDYPLDGKILYTQRFCDSCPSEERFPITEILGHPIYLHTILDKAEVVLCWEEEERKDKIYEIWCLWYECGLSRSLQEIVQASGWEYTLTARDEDSSIRKTEVLTSSEANALCEYLLSLFPIPNE